MIKIFFLVVSIFSPALLAVAQCIEADLILHEGNIYTGKNNNSFVGSIAAKDSKLFMLASHYLM